MKKQWEDLDLLLFWGGLQIWILRHHWLKSLKNSLMLRSSSLDFFLRGVPVVQLSLDARLKYLMFAPSISRAPEGVSSMLSYYCDDAMSSTLVMPMCSEQLCWIYKGDQDLPSSPAQRSVTLGSPLSVLAFGLPRAPRTSPTPMPRPGIEPTSLSQ